MLKNITIPEELIPTDPRFGSGPSLLKVESMKKMAETGAHLLGTSHRKFMVKDLVKEVQEGLAKYFNIPEGYEIVFGNGGATFFWDMMGLGLVEKKAHCFVTGEFSNKCFKALDNISWIETVKTEVDYGRGVEITDDGESDLICSVLNETSTGVQITKMPDRREGRLLAIDATSGAGQIQCDLNKIDIYYFSPQKAFGSEGGLFIAIMSPQAIERALRLRDNKNYCPVIMDFKLAIDNSRKNQTYNTPSLSTFFFLNEQIKEFNSLGEARVCEMAQEKADYIYSWAEDKPHLECFIEEQNYRSNSVATINVDEKFDVVEIASWLRDQKIAYDIESYRKLGKNQMRISLFHNVSLENLKKLTQVLDLIFQNN